MKTIFRLLAAALLITNISCKQNSSAKDENTISKQENKFDNKGTVVHIDNAAFKEIIMDYTANPKSWVFKGQKPCIVDFYADWCGPCKHIGPIMEELAKEYSGKINIYKVNVDNEKELSTFFKIESIPALIFSPMKGDPTIQAGALDKEDYIKMIDEILLKTQKDTTKIN